MEAEADPEAAASDAEMRISEGRTDSLRPTLTTSDSVSRSSSSTDTRCPGCCRPCRKRCTGEVRLFDEPADEDAYVAYAHRSAWLRLGTVTIASAAQVTLYYSRRQRTWKPDESASAGFVAVATLVAVASVIMLTTMPACTRRAATALGPTRVAALPAVLQRVIATDGALAFEAALVALIASVKVVEIFVFEPEPLYIVDEAGARWGVAVQGVIAAWYLCMPSPPRFWPLGPYLLAALVVAAGASFGLYARRLTGGYLGASVALLTTAASLLATAVALWAWDSQRRRAFLTLQRNAARKEATRAVVSALASLSRSAKRATTSGPSDGDAESGEPPSTSTSRSGELAKTPTTAVTATVVVLQHIAPEGLASRHFRALSVLADALALASQATRTDVAATAVWGPSLVAVVSPDASSDERPSGAADAAVEATVDTSFPLDVGAMTRRAVILAQATLRLAAEIESHRPADTDRARQTAGRSQPPAFVSDDAVEEELSQLRGDAEAARLAVPDAAGDDVEFSAAMTLGAVEIAPAPPGAPAGAAALSGDAVLRALEVASLCSPGGQTVMSGEVRAALAQDFATAYVRSYVPQHHGGGDGDGEPASRVGIYVRGVPWSRAAQHAEALARAQLEGVAVPLPGAPGLTRCSTEDGSEATDSTGERSATSIALEATPPPFGFRFPWGLQFDDAELEHEFRRVEHAGAARLPVAVYAVALLLVLPVLGYVDGSAPDGLGYFLWGVRSALGLANVALCFVERPGPRVLVLHAVFVCLLSSGLTLPWFRHMHRAPTLPLLYDSQTQYIFDLLGALLVTPSVLPWWIIFGASLFGNVTDEVRQPGKLSLSLPVLVIGFALTFAGILFAVYAVRLRQRHAFAALVASERAVEAWATRRLQLEQELELLTWPCVARDSCDAVAAGAPLGPREYATVRVWLGAPSRRQLSAADLRSVALTVYSHPEARGLGLAVEALPDGVLVIADATRGTSEDDVMAVVREAAAESLAGVAARSLPSKVALAGFIGVGNLRTPHFFAVHGHAMDEADDVRT